MKELFNITRNFANDRRRLNHKLKQAGISFEWHKLYDGYQWTFPAYPAGDIALHGGTHGAGLGFFESYGCPWDNGDVSVLSRTEVIERLNKGE